MALTLYCARASFAVLVRSVLPLCCYGKVLDFMIKNTRFTKKTLDYKLTHSENAQKSRCNANHRHCATSPVALRWLCDSLRTGCVKNNTTHICGANKQEQRDHGMWTLLSLAATVRSFAHMPLRISDRNTTHCKNQRQRKREIA